MGAADGEEEMPGVGDSGERILVSVRLRPLNEKEIARNDASDWECINDTTIIHRNSLSVSERSVYPSAYTFDRVFTYDCSTRKVYEDGAKEVALSVVSGINSTIFAYGQTSSGKTYTMSGITEFTVADIFNYMEKHMEREFILKFSAIEIYNESVRDLLSADNTPLRLLDDPERGTIVEKITEESISDWNHFKELLSLCEAQRQIGETSLNVASSRSHQILRLTIESSAREFLGNEKSTFLAATVNFVDLAGSERASQSLSAGARLKEGCHINRSLLTLGTVIRKLSKGRNGHIPFRDSKLTRILQSSLGGNARTAIICTMSPARSHMEQSRNTLLFASCAKEVTTNAQVNVVVSDKALVKKLQRELARLETQLRSSGVTPSISDSAALLREKDFQIEKLKEEIKELTVQLDLARSQVQISGDDEPPKALSVGNEQYPKLRVRGSWDLGNQISVAPSSANLNYLNVSVGSFDASQYSDGHSRSSSENYQQLFDFEDSFKQTNQEVSVNTPLSDSETRPGGIQEQSNDDVEDICKEVRCIEMEESSAKRYVDSSTEDLSPNRYSDSCMSSIENLCASELKGVENGDGGNAKLGLSPPLKEDKELKNFHSIFVVPSSEKSSSWSDLGNLKLTRSRSCKASFRTSMSSDGFEKVGKNDTTPTWCEKVFPGRPENFLKEPPAHENMSDIEKLSRNGSQTSIGNVAADEFDEFDAENIDTSITEKKMVEHQLPDNMVLDTESKPVGSAKNLKDVGLDPIPDDLESPGWPAEFKALQSNIIELWHSCNISLIHRTYFFLLFKGDPADSIYMEVEFRRLSFLGDTFSRGNQTIQDVRHLTISSSMRDLRHERQMLSKQMQKRLSKQEREALFVEWGISLSSSHRRLQLVHCLWTDTKDMYHIRRSANAVAKLVGYVEPEQGFKGMFGLNFTPPCRSHKSRGWMHGMMSHS